MCAQQEECYACRRAGGFALIAKALCALHSLYHRLQLDWWSTWPAPAFLFPLLLVFTANFSSLMCIPFPCAQMEKRISHPCPSLQKYISKVSPVSGLQTEKRILRKLADADQLGRRHCIKLQRSFEYRGHLCLVFDAMVSPYRGSCLVFDQRQAPCMQPVQAGCQVWISSCLPD